MSHVLYRKYRSQIFDDLIGQEHIATILKNAVAQDQISHAYLFYGPRGLGKTSTARILAKAVNCPQLQPDGNPCDTCEVCVAVREGKFLDMIEIDAASNRGIDQIRELKERIEFSPSEGKKKVYIIDEVHMMTTEAFNALLKTLEEPPPHVVFILATTEIHKVPATIMSRCQRFDFRLGSDEDVKQLIDRIIKEEGIKVDDGAMDLFIDNARGSYRDALSLLDVVVSGKGKRKNITEEEVRAVLGLADSTMAYFFLEKLINCESGEALDLVQELAQKGVNLGQFVKFVLSVLREILVGGLRGKVDLVEYSFAEKLDRRTTLKLINLFVEAERGLKDALVPTLPLELLVADAMDIFPGDSGGNKVKSQSGKGSDSPENGGGKKPSKGSDSDRKKSIGPTSKRPATKGSKRKIKKESVKKSNSRDKALDAKKSEKISMKKSELEKKWANVLKELRPFNSHLYAFIGRSQVLELKDGILKLAVAFDFHKDRIESPKSRNAIATVFNKVFGQAVKLECIIDNSIRSAIKAAPDVVVEAKKETATVNVSAKSGNIYDSVAEVFGDELVGM